MGIDLCIRVPTQAIKVVHPRKIGYLRREVGYVTSINMQFIRNLRN